MLSFLEGLSDAAERMRFSLAVCTLLCVLLVLLLALTDAKKHHKSRNHSSNNNHRSKQHHSHHTNSRHHRSNARHHRNAAAAAAAAAQPAVVEAEAGAAAADSIDSYSTLLEEGSAMSRADISAASAAAADAVVAAALAADGYTSNSQRYPASDRAEVQQPTDEEVMDSDNSNNSNNNNNNDNNNYDANNEMLASAETSNPDFSAGDNSNNNYDNSNNNNNYDYNAGVMASAEMAQAPDGTDLNNNNDYSFDQLQQQGMDQSFAPPQDISGGGEVYDAAQQFGDSVSGGMLDRAEATPSLFQQQQQQQQQEQQQQAFMPLPSIRPHTAPLAQAYTPGRGLKSDSNNAPYFPGGTLKEKKAVEKADVAGALGSIASASAAAGATAAASTAINMGASLLMNPSATTGQAQSIASMMVGALKGLLPSGMSAGAMGNNSATLMGMPPSPDPVPMPTFARYIKCAGCISTVEGLIGGAQFPAVCMALNETSYAPVCSFMSGQATYLTAQVTAKFPPISICFVMMLCDAGDSGILSSAYTPLMGVPYVIKSS